MTGGTRPLVGVHPTSTDLSMPVLDLATETEARGLRSIYLPEHTHIPLESAFPTGGPIPERYRHTLDPYVASAFVAARTSLEVGTAVSLIAQHDAIALAKAIATLDHLAPGRIVVGVGFGYNRPEAADHGIPLRERAEVVEETVGLMRAFWTQEVASYDGKHVRVSPSWSWPKPAPTALPPVLLGVRPTSRNLDRIVSWCDGWIPMGQAPADAGFEDDLAELRRRWRAAGRDSEPQICCFFSPGDRAAMANQIDNGERLGVQRMQVFLEDRRRDEVLPILDDLAAAARA